MRRLLPVVLAVALFPFVLVAQEEPEDAEGCTDSSVLSRMPKCRIDSCEKKDFDEADLRIGPDGEADFPTQHVEGSKEHHVYECEEAVSFINIARNAETALKKGGFSIVWFGKGQNDRPALAARKGGVWVGIQTETNGTRPIYEQTVVVTQEMAQTMVASAAALEEEVARTGSCSIYGVLFDTGKATIQPSSAECLNEVVKLLQNNSAWHMQVEGHTDNVGAAAANATLSQQRAESVKAWLVARGIAATRLTAKGFGDSKPIADNTTDDGRTKNRRVTFTKR